MRFTKQTVTPYIRNAVEVLSEAHSVLNELTYLIAPGPGVEELLEKVKESRYRLTTLLNFEWDKVNSKPKKKKS